MTDEEVRGLLRDLRDEPVPPDSLARVRLAVAERSARSRWFMAPWKAAAAIASFAVLVLLVVWMRPAHHPVTPVPVSPREVAATQPPVLPPITAPATKVRASAASTTKQKIKQKPENPTGEGLVVRIETEDPDIVILLIGD
jgi:anti-sigma factor RsiW